MHKDGFSFGIFVLVTEHSVCLQSIDYFSLSVMR